MDRLGQALLGRARKANNIESNELGDTFMESRRAKMWYCSIKDPLLADEETFRSLLDLTATAREKESILKFVFTDDRKRGFLSLLLQRAMIQITFPQFFSNSTSYVIQRTRENKPFLSIESFPQDSIDQLGNWNYNVSHHGSFVGIASSFHYLIGVDIVDVLTRSGMATSCDQYVRMFRQQLTTNEINYILQSDLSEEQQYRRFFIFWSLKEAYIKAIGLGLGYDLLRVEFYINYSRFSKPNKDMKDTTNLENTFQLQPQSDCWWEGEADVRVDGILRSDWRCYFYPLDQNNDACDNLEVFPPRHLMTVAIGPFQEAIPTFQQLAWGLNESCSISKSIGENDFEIQQRPHEISIKELLATIGIQSTSI